MFTEAQVIAVLTSQVARTNGINVPVEPAKSKEENMLLPSNVNKYYVGYGEIIGKHGNYPTEADIFEDQGEDLIQSFDVMFVCKRADVKSFFDAMFKTMIGVNPIPEETSRSGFKLTHSGPLGYNSEYIYWYSKWVLGFPTVYTFFST
jgi:hypothetical protein